MMPEPNVRPHTVRRQPMLDKTNRPVIIGRNDGCDECEDLGYICDECVDEWLGDDEETANV